MKNSAATQRSKKHEKMFLTMMMKIFAAYDFVVFA